MIGRWMSRVIKMILFVLIGSVVFGFIIEALWNWLVPGLFGWHRITFWQAVGLFVLSKILFGGLHTGRGRGGRGRRDRWKGGMWRRWQQMTPEDREKFRAGMRDCGKAWGPGGEFRGRHRNDPRRPPEPEPQA